MSNDNKLIRYVDGVKSTPTDRRNLLDHLLRDPELMPQEAEAPEFVGIGETLDDAMRHIAVGDQVNGLSTGYRQLDRMTGGLSGGQVVLIYGDTGLGKSLLAQNIAVNVSAEVPVCFIGLEMTNAENTARFITMTDEQTASTMPIFYPAEDKTITTETLDGLYAAAKKEGAGLIVIDHLHAMELPSAGSEAAAIDAMVWTIKRVSRKYSLPTLLLSHIDKAGSGKGFPSLNSLKGSSSIKQVTDTALAIARDLEEDPQTLKVKLVKIRGRGMKHSQTSLILSDNARLSEKLEMANFNA